MANELTILDEKTMVTTDFSQFENYLVALKLPTENIIAAPEERLRIMNAIPEFINSLPIEMRKDARYLSKFIAGAAVGLFDASLNFVWNEVVINLRKKAVLYGLDMFFDEAVGGKNRDSFSTEEDLAGIKDRTLLDTCLKLELISDLVHKKLVHILDMRNDIGSSHPNQYSINSYELLGWLQTCIKEVLKEESSKSSITVRQIITNIKKSTTKFDKSLVDQFADSLKEVSKILIGNLLTTMFNMYVSNQTDQIIKQNIVQLAPCVWNETCDSKKYELGILIDQYKANLDTEKVKNAEKFFEICDGKRYLSLSERVCQLNSLCDSLEQSHYERDNFYNEVPPARSILTYIKKAEDIPHEIEEKLLQVFLICRIGKEVSWLNGVSPNGKNYYDKLFSILNEDQIKQLLRIILKPEIRSSFYGNIRTNNFKEIIPIISENLISERMKEVVEFVKNERDLSTLLSNKKFIELAKGILF